MKRPNERVNDKENFNLGLSAFITENKNKITREYNLLSPPLGKGAFGEVRQAINRETGIARAIKIIQKSGCTQKELARIEKEVIWGTNLGRNFEEAGPP